MIAGVHRIGSEQLLVHADRIVQDLRRLLQSAEILDKLAEVARSQGGFPPNCYVLGMGSGQFLVVPFGLAVELFRAGRLPEESALVSADAVHAGDL